MILILHVYETWFDSGNGKFTSMIKNAGFDINHAHREEKAGGGTAIIYDKKLGAKQGEISISEFTSFEYSNIYLNVESNSKILLSCVYRKQEVSCTTFVEELEKYLKRIFNKAEVLILTGDFNVWVDVEDDVDAKKVLKIMNSYGLTQLVNGPTHDNGHTLDQIYLNQYQINTKVTIVDTKYDICTDHFPINIELLITQPQTNNKIISFRNKKNINMIELR